MQESTVIGGADARREDLERLREENRQLRAALDSRVAIERATGTLAERLELSLDEAFELLRYSARTARMPLHELARMTRPSEPTPASIVVGLARSRGRPRRDG